MKVVLISLCWSLFVIYLVGEKCGKSNKCQLIAGGGCGAGNCCPQDPPKCCDPSCPKCIGGKAPKRGSGCLGGCPLAGCCPGYCPCDDCVCCYTSTSFVTETFTKICEKMIPTTTTTTSSRTIYTTQLITSIIPLTFTVEEVFTYRSVTTFSTFPFAPFLTTEVLQTERVQSASTIYINTIIVNELTTTRTTNPVTTIVQPVQTSIYFVTFATLETDQETFLPTILFTDNVTRFTQVDFSTIVISNILESSNGSTDSTGNALDNPILKSGSLFDSNVALDINTIFQRTIVQTYFQIFTITDKSSISTTFSSAPSYYTVPVNPLTISGITFTTLTQYRITGFSSTLLYRTQQATTLGQGTFYQFVYPKDSFTVNSKTISTYLCTNKIVYDKCVLDMQTNTQIIDLIPTRTIVTGTTETKVYVPIEIVTERTTFGISTATETLTIDPYLVRI